MNTGAAVGCESMKGVLTWMMEDVSKSVTLPGDAPRSFPYPIRLGQVQASPRLLPASPAFSAPARRTTAKRRPVRTTLTPAATREGGTVSSTGAATGGLPFSVGAARAR